MRQCHLNNTHFYYYYYYYYYSSATDQDRTIKFGIKYAHMDFYTNLTFNAQKERGLGSRDPLSKFWKPL